MTKLSPQSKSCSSEVVSWLRNGKKFGHFRSFPVDRVSELLCKRSESFYIFCSKWFLRISETHRRVKKCHRCFAVEQKSSKCDFLKASRFHILQRMPRPVFLLDQPHLVRRRFSQKKYFKQFFIARRKFVNSLIECNFAAVVKCIMVKKNSIKITHC